VVAVETLPYLQAEKSKRPRRRGRAGTMRADDKHRRARCDLGELEGAAGHVR
jgi:hypothetical protein